MILTSYFRSTAAYRVRIALNLKELEHELSPLNLFTGEQKTTEFLNRNPDGLIPTLQVGDDLLTQSMAILEYLEEVCPTVSLLPKDPIQRAFVRALAQTIVSDIHPLNNLRVQQYLVSDMGVSDDKKLQWYQHWVATGFDGLETRLKKSAGEFCFADTLSIADVCLIPQVYNAHRFNCPMDDYPTINRLNQTCLKLDAFANAAPELQPDAT
ncbi:MAG: maleylacetoacetate isomerase [Arenicella sp.]|jgi:maleylacetoacetate isomerase